MASLFLRIQLRGDQAHPLPLSLKEASEVLLKIVLRVDLLLHLSLRRSDVGSYPQAPVHILMGG